MLVGKLQTAWRMPAKARTVALRALCVTPLVELALRSLPLPTVCRWLGIAVATPTPGNFASGNSDEIKAAVRCAQKATDLALRNWGCPNNCLRRALVTGHLMRHHRPSLRIGVRRHNDRCEAHAWLTIGQLRVDLSSDSAAFQELVGPSAIIQHDGPKPKQFARQRE